MGETGWITATVAVVAWVISSGTKYMQSESKRTPRPPAAPPAASGAGRFVDMASARREGACNPHNRCRCLLIEPAAAEHYCPDCLLGAVLWDASGYVPRALECRDCGSQFALACLRTEPAGP